MRDCIPNYEARRERSEHFETSRKLQKRQDEYLALRKLMREYFRETLNEPHNQLPEHIKKAIGLK